MDFFTVAKIIQASFGRKSILSFIQTYGIDILLDVISAIMEAERNPLFQKSGSGPEKASWVINKIKGILVENGLLKGKCEIPIWLPAVINELIKLINKFIRKK